MRKFFRYLVAVLFQFSFAAFLLLATVRFLALDPNFLITSFRNADVYRQSVEIFREYLGDTVRSELQAAGFDKLPIEQQQILEDQITGLTSAIEEKEVQDLAETNIDRFYNYINGEAGDLVLYFPVHNWGLPNLILSQEPFSLLSENTTLETIMSKEVAANAKMQLSQAREYIESIRIVWFIPLVLSLLLLLIHYLLSKSPQRIKPTAWLLIVGGIYTLLMCGTAYLGSNEFVKKTVSYGEPILLMMGTIVPYLFLTIIYFWAKIAGGLISIGVLILITQLVVTKSQEKKQKKMETPLSPPPTTASAQPQQNPPIPVAEKVIQS